MNLIFRLVQVYRVKNIVRSRGGAHVFLPMRPSLQPIHGLIISSNVAIFHFFRAPNSQPNTSFFGTILPYLRLINS